MAPDNRSKSRTAHQIGAFVTLLLLVIWSLAVFWVHMVSPAGAAMFELIYLGTLTVMFLILLPLYWKHIRWAYIGGVLVVIAMFVGIGIENLYRDFVLSWSLFNVGTVLAYVVALACAYFSIRSYRELAPVETKKTLFGVGGIVLVAAIVAVVLWVNQGLVQRTMWQWTLNRMDNRLQSLETLDEQIQFLVDNGDLTSVVGGIVVDGFLVWAKAYGEADLDTVYDIGSVTKPFVATAVLQLYEKGLIDLDDDGNEYLPFSLRHPEYPDTPITIRMLLTHQSGLAHSIDQYMGYHMGEETVEWMSENRGWHLPRYDASLSFAEFLEGYVTPGGAYYMPGAWVAAEPGTGYSYSTPGYDILAYLVECVTGQPFSEYARDNIFISLGMTSTGFSVADFPGRVALPYERVYGVLSKTIAELPLSDERTIGGGGMLSTVPDLAQFVIAHLNQGQVGGVQLLEPETIELMQEQAVSFPLGRGDLNQVSYGLGFGHIREEPWSVWGHLYDMHGATGHGGSWFGYQAQMWFVEREEGGYGVILLTNTESDFKAEARSLWMFASPLKLQVLLMEEAALMHQSGLCPYLKP